MPRTINLAALAAAAPNLEIIPVSDKVGTRSTASQTSTTPKRPCRMDAIKAMTLLKEKGFLGQAQFATVKHCMVGEEKQFFFDKMVELAGIVDKMPATQESKRGDDAIVHLHYFAGGSANWYITEKDVGAADDEENGIPPQSQAFGLANLFGGAKGHDAELGYISIAEILANRGELDFYWTPKTLGELRSGDAPVAEESAAKAQPLLQTPAREDWDCPDCGRKHFIEPPFVCTNDECPSHKPPTESVMLKMNQAPPGGWKPEDKVPDHLRKLSSTTPPTKPQPRGDAVALRGTPKETTMPETKITLKRGKDCKHSVRFETTDPDAAVSNVYLSRKHPASNGQTIVVTVAASE